MTRFSMKIEGAESFERLFLAAPGIVFSRARRAFQEIGFQARKRMIDQASPTLKPLLRRGLVYRVYPERNRLTGGFVGSSGQLEDLKLWFAANKAVTAHETGGVIRAKDKLMPVPILKGRRAGGQTLKRYRKKGGVSGIRREGGIIVRRSKAGNLIAFRVEKRGAKRKLVPVAVLKESITLQATAGIRRTWQAAGDIRADRLANARRLIIEDMKREVRRAVAS